MEKAPDIREEIFQKCINRRVTGSLIAEVSGVLSGIERAREMMDSLGLLFISELEDGAVFEADQEVARVVGHPVRIAMAEERIIGALSKSCGIATVAQQARTLAGSALKVVSGGWKKMPLEIKDTIRQAVCDGGIGMRISEKPFVYLDKNYIRILGGVKEAVQAAEPLGRSIVIQVRGETGSVEQEATEAAEAGASVVMVDTGRQEHLSRVTDLLKKKGLRSGVQVAFAGNISINELEDLAQMDLDIVDIGYAILDAPCLPMRFDVIEVA